MQITRHLRYKDVWDTWEVGRLPVDRYHILKYHMAAGLIRHRARIAHVVSKMRHNFPAVFVLQADTSGCETGRDWKDRTGNDKYEPDEQPHPPRRCPRCLGSDFEFIECYWPVRASQRPLRPFQARPP